MIRFARLVLIAIALTGATICIARADDAKRSYSLKYALLVDGEDPIAGEADCVIDKPCEFLRAPIGNITAKFTRSAGEVEIECPDLECSFKNGRNKTWCGICNEMGIFEGRDYGVETLLVLRQRPQFGTLLLRYEK